MRHCVLFASQAAEIRRHQGQSCRSLGIQHLTHGVLEFLASSGSEMGISSNITDIPEQRSLSCVGVAGPGVVRSAIMACSSFTSTNFPGPGDNVIDLKALFYRHIYHIWHEYILYTCIASYVGGLRRALSLCDKHLKFHVLWVGNSFASQDLAAQIHGWSDGTQGTWRLRWVSLTDFDAD